jgi:hypothetical protein
MKRLWVVGVLVPWLSLAQSLSAAETLYADGELPAALKAADAALKTTTESKEVSKLHVVRGLVLLAQSKKDKAKAAFGQALQADAEAQLDAQRVPPAAVQLFEQAREAVPPGTVSVTAEGDATLRIDGVDVGPLPLTTRVPVGRHQLEATGMKGEVMRAEVVVQSAKVQTVNLVPTTPTTPGADTNTRPPPPPPPPLVESQPSASSAVETSKVTLLETPRPQVKQTFWGMIPIAAAALGGWVGPGLLAGAFPEAGILVTIGGSLALGLGTALLAASAAEVEASVGPAQMNWWGLIPLAAGLAGAVAAFLSLPYFVGNLNTQLGISSAVAGLGLGIGSGMLVGRAIGLSASAPKVSFFVDPQGGGGLAVAGRF